MKTCYLLLDCLKVCPSVLTGNKRFLTFSSNITEPYILYLVSLLLLSMIFWKKADINITHLSLHILTLSTDFNDPKKFKHRIISQILNYCIGKPSSKGFQKRFLAHHEQLSKTNENRSVISKNFKPIFQEKSHHGLLSSR